jgi:DNA-directed RNA polymerase specialized sigma24 family protein
MTARDYVAVLASCMSARIDARPRAAWRYWVAEITKELAKNAVRHPNRRWSSLHDWRCQTLRAHFDSQMTEQALGWRPVADRPTMEQRGIVDAVKWFLR